MGRSPRCSKDGLNKGAWTALEDQILTDYIKAHGEGKWSNVAKETGLKRCGKSCRLRWMNYLRPDIKRGNISNDEEELIIRLHKLLGNRWSLIAGRLPGRTDNEIKNYWNTNLAKKAQELQLTLPKLERQQTATISTRPFGSTVLLRSPPELRGLTKLHGTADVATPQQDSQEPQQRAIGPCKDDSDHNTESSDDASSSDFMIDFNVDDFCKMLDSDDFAKLANDIHMADHGPNSIGFEQGGDHHGDGAGDVVNYVNNGGCKNEIVDHQVGKIPLPMKLEENKWSGSGREGNHECAPVADPASSDFMSLVNFLDSGEGWPGDV